MYGEDVGYRKGGRECERNGERCIGRKIKRERKGKKGRVNGN